MKIESAFLANHVEVRDSLVFASGAFPEWWTVSHLPTLDRFFLGVVLRVEPDENETLFRWVVSAVGPDGVEQDLAEIGTKRMGQIAKDGSPLYQSVVVPLDIEFRATGLHMVRFKGTEDCETTIHVGLRLMPKQ